MIRLALLGTLAATAASSEGLCFGFLNAHPERTEIPAEAAQLIQKAHLAHMEALAKAGHLIVAGPFLTPGGPRGVVVYRCDSLARAIAWTEPDPAVRNKRLAVEMYRWNGPADFGEPLASQVKKDPDAAYRMVCLPLVVFRKTEKWSGAKPALRSPGIRAGGELLDGSALAVYIFSAVPLDQAKAIAQTDPAVLDGEARVEAYVWMVADTAIPGATAATSSTP
jgi:uncharacterized protein YciI